MFGYAYNFSKAEMRRYHLARVTERVPFGDPFFPMRFVCIPIPHDGVINVLYSITDCFLALYD